MADEEPKRRGDRGGRPPLDRSSPSMRFSLTVSNRQFDELYRRARQARTTVPAYIRSALKLDASPLEKG